MNRLLQAVAFAITAHGGQFRKSAGQNPEPQIVHSIRVANILVAHGVTEEETLMAAVLHDTIEDTATTYADLSRLFGSLVADVVMELSDEPGLTKAEQRAAQLAHAPTLSTRAKRIKVADKMDNVRSLRDDPPPWSTSLKLAYMESAEGVVRAIGGDYVEGTLVGAFFRTLLDVRKAVSAS